MCYTGDESKKTEKDEVIDPRCIVEFRPVDNWKGEYGFDWFRRGDTKERFNKKDNKSSYSTLVGKYIPKVLYNAIFSTTIRQNDFKRIAKYDKNTKEATDQNTQNDCLNELCKEYLRREIRGENRLYYIPTLSLFYNNYLINENKWGPTKAVVKLLIDAKDIKRLEFICDEGIIVETDTVNHENSLLEIDSRLPDGSEYISDNPKKYIDIGSEKKELYLEVSSFLDSSNSKESTKSIKVYAKTEEEIKNNVVGSFSGRLNVVLSKVKVIDICIVNVRIKSNGNQCPVHKPDEIEKEKERIRKALAQAHVLPHFMPERTIDMEENQHQEYFHRTTQDNKPVMLIDVPPSQSPVSNLFDDLSAYFNSPLTEDEKTKFGEVYKLFFINKSGGMWEYDVTDPNNPHIIITGGLLGQARDLGGKETIVFKNNDSATVPHELFHCMGLEHTFENSNRHTFKALETSNLMDYSEEGFSLWKWQWEELRKNRKDFSIEDFVITNLS